MSRRFHREALFSLKRRIFMDKVIEAIGRLFGLIYSSNPDRIEKLPQSGSDRIYFRIYAGVETFIATYSLNVKETQTFIYFSKHFINAGLPVPIILGVNDDNTIYIQQDLGTESLLNQLEQHGRGEYVYGLFQQSLSQLARLQILGDKGLNYDYSLTAKEFGKQAIMSDLLYFKYYFLDTLQLPYDKQAMLDDFEALSTYLAHTQYKYFMFRDFQSRNIMVKNDAVSFIDYQGGMKGALQYDVASLLWQAKAELSEEWKNSLLDYYMDCIDLLLEQPVDRTTFTSQYNGYVLIRLLQVMGAYGFRGLFERKAHFLASIPLALRNLKFFIDHKRVGIVTPEFDRVLRLVVRAEMIERFEPVQANEQTPLLVQINSFSYKKGIPDDDSENGGGFVFDMRSIFNPGRFDEYKTLTGKDKPVQDFLEQRTKMNEYLNSVWDLIDIAVEDYLKRGFNHLMINFGCTGGQHRSVYAAEQTARHLRNKYKVKVALTHTNSENWLRDIQ
jgi:aminoglycoside/choline kinase family phosphotransferase